MRTTIVAPPSPRVIGGEGVWQVKGAYQTTPAWYSSVQCSSVVYSKVQWQDAVQQETTRNEEGGGRGECGCETMTTTTVDVMKCISRINDVIHETKTYLLLLTSYKSILLIHGTAHHHHEVHGWFCRAIQPTLDSGNQTSLQRGTLCYAWHWPNSTIVDHLWT